MSVIDTVRGSMIPVYVFDNAEDSKCYQLVASILTQQGDDSIVGVRRLDCGWLCCVLRFER